MLLKSLAILSVICFGIHGCSGAKNTIQYAPAKASKTVQTSKNGVTVSLEATCLSPEEVVKGRVYKCTDGNTYEGTFEASTGTSSQAIPNCSSDGELNCVSVASFRAASTAGLEAKIISTATVAGISGGFVVPPANDIRSTTTYGFLSLLNGAFAPDFPAIGNVLSTDTVNGISGTLTLPSASDVKSAVVYGVSGIGSTGNYSPDFPAAGNVLSTDTVNGVSGTLTLPSASDVKSGVVFGVGGNGTTGAFSPDYPNASNVRNNDTVNSVAGTLADCSSDGAVGCVTTSQYKSIDTNALTGWDIRVGKQAGGILGGLKFCRNTINTSVYNYASQSSPRNQEKYGTIDNYNGGNALLPGTVPAAWASLACGSSNWQDVSGGNGGIGFENTACSAGSSAATGECQMRDNLTGLIWSAQQTSASGWNPALSACDNLTWGSVAAGTWRLPTANELLQVAMNGIKSVQSPHFIVSADNIFWSSTTASYSPNIAALTVHLSYARIEAGGNGKASSTNNVICVRP